MIFFNEIYVVSIVLASILFWTLVKDEYRNWFITIASFSALYFIQPVFSIVLIFIVFCVYLYSKIILKSNDKRSRIMLLTVISLTIILLTGKYLGILYGEIFSNESEFAKSYLIPLGISYLIFKLIAFVLDVFRGIIEKPSFDELLSFVFFLPAFPAGPIERYQNFAGKRLKKFSGTFYIEGLQRLSLGYFKKVVIVNFILNEILIKKMYPIIIADNVSLDLSAWMVLSFLIVSLFYAYFDLSAYADMAIGYGQLFGYRVTENMNYPIYASNLSEYWDRWHMTLSGWCRNNVYFPVLASTRRNNMALYASFIVMGLWHNISFNWFLWGVWHASGIWLFSKWRRNKNRKKIKNLLPRPIDKIIGISITIIYSSLGFSFIMFDSHTDFVGSTERAIRLIFAIFI